MDIQLNIAKPIGTDKKPQQNAAARVSKATREPSSSNFSVNFVKAKKVTAILARKRPVKPTPSACPAGNNGVKSPGPLKAGYFLPAGQNKIASSKGEGTRSEEDILLDIAACKKDPEGSLSLNIISDTTQISQQPIEKKRRLTRIERKQKTMQRRIDQSKSVQINKAPQSKQVAPPLRVAAVQTNLQTVPKSSSTKTIPSNPVSRPSIPAKTKVDSMFSHNPEIPKVGQRFVAPIKEILFSGLPMSSINLHPHLVKTLADLLNITELTTVQQRAVPIALEGRDVLVRSQTGSGKTLAYALPIVQRLQEIQPKIKRTDGIFTIIIVPTRELAIQTHELFIKLLKPFTWIVSTYFAGGEKRKAEKSRLRKGVNILIGTPGRLCDHILHSESFKMNQIKYLVLDEADRLYELGYEKDVKMIVDSIKNSTESTESADTNNQIVNNVQSTSNTTVQSLLLSATLTPAVKQLAGLALKNPLFIDTSEKNNVEISDQDDLKRMQCGGNKNVFNEAIENAIENQMAIIPSTISQSYALVPTKQRLVTLCGLLSNETFKKTAKILIFFPTENLVDFHYDMLTEILTKSWSNDDDDYLDGNSDLDDEDDLLSKPKAKSDDETEPFLDNVKFFKLHGSLTQLERSAIFKEFRTTDRGILLTTDLSARGIDILAIDLVIQFSPPHRISDYVHRVGRTARAGNSGRAILFLSPNEVQYVRELEDKKIRISQDDYKTYLKGVLNKDMFSTGRMEEDASELQRLFEKFVKGDASIYTKACKAYASWLKFMSSFPRAFRDIFNTKSCNIGHYAKSLGLLEKPKALLQQYNEPKIQPAKNRLTYVERSNDSHTAPKGLAKKSSANGKLNQLAKRSVSLAMSEFDSGLPAKKKKKN